MPQPIPQDVAEPDAPLTGKAKYGKRVTAAEMDKRVDTVVRLLVEGHRRRGILEYISDHTDWEIGRAMVDYYIAKATAVLESEAKGSRRYFMGQARARYHRVFHEALKAGNHSAAVRAQRELDKLTRIVPSPQSGAGEGTPTDPPPQTDARTISADTVQVRLRIIAELVQVAEERAAAKGQTPG